MKPPTESHMALLMEVYALLRLRRVPYDEADILHLEMLGTAVPELVAEIRCLRGTHGHLIPFGDLPQAPSDRMRDPRTLRTHTTPPPRPTEALASAKAVEGKCGTHRGDSQPLKAVDSALSEAGATTPVSTFPIDRSRR